jgi:hypothetical protein
VSFCIDHYVTARVSKFAFGTDCYISYDATNPEHTSRRDDKYVDLDGDEVIGGLFSNILPMVRCYSMYFIIYTKSNGSRVVRYMKHKNIDKRSGGMRAFVRLLRPSSLTSNAIAGSKF